jgi:hypothetical protein
VKIFGMDGKQKTTKPAVISAMHQSPRSATVYVMSALCAKSRLFMRNAAQTDGEAYTGWKTFKIPMARMLET